MRIESFRTPNFLNGRDGATPRAIVVHTSVGSFGSAVDWFGRRESGVSAHYLVGLRGRVGQFVDETDTARHAGNVRDPTAASWLVARDPNLVSVGIEFEDGGDPAGCARPPAQYASGAELIARIGERWGIPLDREHVVGHREIYAAKSCPGNLDIERLIDQALAS
jgi:N-acetyl-anhydromuramyl-L-alanine amidase AmpD